MTEIQPSKTQAEQDKPWYRHFWVWFIIALPTAAVTGGLLTLWIAMSNPDFLVIDDDEYSQLRSSLKAEPAETEEGSSTKQESRDD